MIQLVPGDCVAEGSALAILAHPASDLAGVGLLPDEAEYVRTQYKDETSCIRIPRLGPPVYVLLTDMEKSPAARMESIRREAVKVQKGLTHQKCSSLSVVDITSHTPHVLAFLEGLMLSGYQFLKYITKAAEKQNTLREVHLVNTNVSSKDLEVLLSVTRAVCFARDMVNEPGSFLTASRMASLIEESGARDGFSVEVLDKQAIEGLNMGGLLAVNRGSSEPPRFVILTWKPAHARNEKPVVLVGKGLTFDTGGLCLKPVSGMDEMKSDMSGGAAVAAVFSALATTGSDVYAVGVIPMTDNRLSATSFTPGDIITMFNGTTVEMINSDAEGRMILADALAYANRFEPMLVIDIATLTGSASAAIGDSGVVAMGNAPRCFMEALQACGEETYERIAEFPFWDEYKEHIKSEIADLKNVGNRYAGAITAGKFLEHFTAFPYIHLDIAGPAYLSKADGYRTQGGTGVGVRLLYHFIHRAVK